jgi:hypothetical protein
MPGSAVEMSVYGDHHASDVDVTAVAGLAVRPYPTSCGLLLASEGNYIR